MSITSQEPTIFPIASNVYKAALDAQRAIKVYEAIGYSAEDVNRTKFKLFFGFTQKVMLNFAVIQICKIYDRSNRGHLIKLV